MERLSPHRKENLGRLCTQARTRLHHTENIINEPDGIFFPIAGMYELLTNVMDPEVSSAFQGIGESTEKDIEMIRTTALLGTLVHTIEDMVQTDPIGNTFEGMQVTFYQHEKRVPLYVASHFNRDNTVYTIGKQNIVLSDRLSVVSRNGFGREEPTPRELDTIQRNLPELVKRSNKIRVRNFVEL